MACLSWSERLAREICRVLGTGAVHPTTPYKWLKGHRPRREEVRQATAFVLSQAASDAYHAELAERALVNNS